MGAHVQVREMRQKMQDFGFESEQAKIEFPIMVSSSFMKSQNDLIVNENSQKSLEKHITIKDPKKRNQSQNSRSVDFKDLTEQMERTYKDLQNKPQK